MSPLSRPAQSLLLACLVGALLVGLAPAPASALEPPRPLPTHEARFVTETDTRPWIDCLWASAAMLLDKWTNGEVRVSHGRLRRLSGDRDGGSSLEDMRVAFRRLGFAVPLDANGESTLTWRGLLARLRRGAGAVVLGDYGDLPRWYGRWDYRFWKGKGKSGDDNHALYVERYDARRGRVWLMDPLARGGYRGEWMSIGALYRFAWIRDGRVQAIATPTAKAAPFTGVAVGDGEVALSRTTLAVTWPVRAPRRWRFPGADARLTVDRAADPLVAAARTALVGPVASREAAAERPTARMGDGDLRAVGALPDEPGAWTAAFHLTDRRFGRPVAESTPVTAFVPGPRRATIRLHGSERQAPAGDEVRVSLTIGNTGEVTWADPDRADVEGREAPPRATRAEATWVRLDAAEDGEAASVPAGELRAVRLAAGEAVRISALLPTPDDPGRWALVIDVVDRVDGSFAALGSAPAVSLFEILPARAGDAGLSVE